ncbi:MAG: HAD family hydrolase, partial [Candidatus Omnitrophota bacterium]
MKVCFDIDGTITERPEFFSLLSRAVRKSGGKVFVVTSRTRSAENMEATKREVNDCGIEYDELHMLEDRAEAER